MFRNIARVSLVAVLALALGLAAVAPASAGEVRKPVASVTSSWLANAWNLVQGLIRGQLTGAPARPLRATASPVTGATWTDPYGGQAYVNTGSCIDPMGNRVPCNQS